MPVQKLDAAFVQRATCPAGLKKIEFRHTEVVGFSLEVRASGGKTYYLRYFDRSGRQRQLKLGGVADCTFAQALKAARRVRSEVVLGGDPLQAKQDTKSVPVFATLAAQVMEYARTYQRRPENTESIIRLHLLPRWGRHRLDEITSQDLSKWLAEKLESGLAPGARGLETRQHRRERIQERHVLFPRFPVAPPVPDVREVVRDDDSHDGHVAKCGGCSGDHGTTDWEC